MRNGQWMKVTLGDDAAGLAIVAGAHRTQDGAFLGIVASPSYTPDRSLCLLPRRVALVNEQGENVMALRGKQLVTLWVEVPGVEFPAAEMRGSLGKPVGLAPCVSRWDIPEERRPLLDPLP